MPHTKWTDDNNWNTPSYVWDKIIPFIPKEKTIWLPFYNDGYSGKYLTEKGFNIIHNDNDFWESNEGECCIDNPPYKIKGIVKLKLKIMERLISLNKPFCLLLPSTSLQTKYFKELSDRVGGFQLIIPREKYDYEKVEGVRTKCLFYTLWICWNMNLPKDYILI
tara:strand:+ start:1289 stop:1780 length:492 start_codon:yes stop_codon:yes gene_type:complete